MDIEYLKMFLYIARDGSISKVAENMHLSQSALSQRIKNMEEMLGADIFQRNHKGVTLTKSGESIYNYVIAITNSYDQMLQELSRLKSADRKIHILSTSVVYSYALPCAIYHVKKNFPDFGLEMETLDSGQIEDKILANHGDIGIIAGKPNDKTLIHKEVFSDSIYLVAGNSVDIPAEISSEQLYNYPLLMLSKTKRTRTILDDYFKETGITQERLQILYDLDSIESIKLSVVNGFSLSFLPYVAIKKELYNKQLRIINIKDFSLNYSYYTIRKPQHHYADNALLNAVIYTEKILKDVMC